MSALQDAVKAYLDKRAAEDELFAKNYAKPNKNIADCCKFIKSEARKQATGGVAAITDAEVFGWAVHYYDEDDIKVPANVPMATTAVAKGVDYKPTEADMQAAREADMRRLEREAYEKLTAPKKVKKDPAADCPTQMSLFA